MTYENKKKELNEDKKTYAHEFLKGFKEKYDLLLPENQLRKDIVIRYYVKEKDSSIVFGLKDYGFYVHERKSMEPFKNERSNAVFYGDSVSLEDLKAICFVLSFGGLPLRTIEPSKYHSDWKSRSIEVGTDTTVVDNPVISIDDIAELELKLNN